MPRASVPTEATVNPGLRTKIPSACLMSAKILSIGQQLLLSVDALNKKLVSCDMSSMLVVGIHLAGQLVHWKARAARRGIVKRSGACYAALSYSRARAAPSSRPALLSQ